MITPYRSNRSSIAPRGTLTLLDTVHPFRWVDQLFRDNWDDLLQSSAGQLAYDEKNSVYSTELDLTGYKKNEVKVEVQDGYVTVTAENQKRGRSSRSFYVSDADPNRVEAKLEDGVLSLSVPRKVEKAAKQIPILGGG